MLGQARTTSAARGGPRKPRMLGQYHVLDPIGRTPLGNVHLARLEGKKGFQRWSSLRIVEPRFAKRPDFVRELEARVRVGASLIHPSVATIFEIGEDGGVLWIASEYVRGPQVSEIVQRAVTARTPVPWDIAARVVADAAEGVFAVYDRLARARASAPQGRVAPHHLVTSFEGKTKLVGAFEPRPDGDPYALPYTAPEELFGDPVDERADVYALGVLLWELCAGRLLFHGSSTEETHALIEAHRIQRLSALSRAVPPVVDEIVKRATASRPDARYPNARELSRAISTAFVAERRVVGEEHVAKYMRSLCGDLLALEEERLREAADTTEVYRRRPASLADSGEAPTPAQGKGAVDPGAFDDETATREMRAHEAADDTVPELPDDGETQEMRTLPMGARQASTSMVDTPALGADAIREMADDMRLTPARGAPSSAPPPAPPSGPTVVKKRPARPRLDSFEGTSGDSEVFFSRSADGQRLVRKPPARTHATPPPTASVLVDDPPTVPGASSRPQTAPRSWAPSSAPPPSGAVPSPFAIPGPPQVPGELRLPPATPAPSVPEAPGAKLGRGLMFAGVGAGIGVIAFLLIVSLAPPPHPPPTLIASSGAPTATAPTVTTTATTPTARPTVTVTGPIPTVAVSSLPQHPTNVPRGTTRPPSGGTKPPPPPPVAGSGFLTVMCNPACDDVLFDGRSLGPSPIFKESVAAGRHKLTLKRDPGVVRAVDANIIPDETTFLKPDMR